MKPEPAAATAPKAQKRSAKTNRPRRDPTIRPTPRCSGDRPGCCAAHEWGRKLAADAPPRLPADAAKVVVPLLDGRTQ